MVKHMIIAAASQFRQSQAHFERRRNMFLNFIGLRIREGELTILDSESSSISNFTHLLHVRGWHSLTRIIKCR